MAGIIHTSMQVILYILHVSKDMKFQQEIPLLYSSKDLKIYILKSVQKW